MLPFPLKKEILIFAAYAKEDKNPVAKLKMLLKMVSRLEKVTCYDRDISPGSEWQQEELQRLQAADILLLLVRWNFLGSDYSSSEQLGQAMKRHEAKLARVLLILLHACPWKESPLRVLKALPEDDKPLNKWPSWPDGLNNIYEGVKKVIEELQRLPASEQFQDRKIWN